MAFSYIYIQYIMRIGNTISSSNTVILGLSMNTNTASVMNSKILAIR